MKPIHLCPPSLQAIAAVLTGRSGNLQEDFAVLADATRARWTFDDCEMHNLAPILCGTLCRQNNLVLGYTETRAAILLHIFIERCHPMCGLTADVECAASWELRKTTWKIYEKHVKILDSLPKS